MQLSKEIQIHYLLIATGVCVLLAIILAYLLAPHLLRKTVIDDSTITVGTEEFKPPIKSTRNPAALPETTSPEPELCAQVITRAKNPKTGETYDFPTPCDVPVGWRTIRNDKN